MLFGILFSVFVLDVVFVPEGHLGNSPPVHWWVAVPHCSGSAEGTADCYLQNCDLNGLCEFQFGPNFHKRCNLETSAVASLETESSLAPGAALRWPWLLTRSPAGNNPQYPNSAFRSETNPPSHRGLRYAGPGLLTRSLLFREHSSLAICSPTIESSMGRQAGFGVCVICPLPDREFAPM